MRNAARSTAPVVVLSGDDEITCSGSGYKAPTCRELKIVTYQQEFRDVLTRVF